MSTKKSSKKKPRRKAAKRAKKPTARQRELKEGTKEVIAFLHRIGRFEARSRESNLLVGPGSLPESRPAKPMALKEIIERMHAMARFEKLSAEVNMLVGSPPSCHAA